MNNDSNGMSLIVKTITRWVKGFIFIFGIYIVLYGHLTPGGGFAGGVIISCAFILITLAFGKEVALDRLNRTIASELDSLGALLFLFVAWSGIYLGGVFFINYIQKLMPGKMFALLSAGTIPIYNIAIGLKVFSSLFMVFIILSVVRVVIRGDEREMIRSSK